MYMYLYVYTWFCIWPTYYRMIIMIIMWASARSATGHSHATKRHQPRFARQLFGSASRSVRSQGSAGGLDLGEKHK